MHRLLVAIAAIFLSMLYASPSMAASRTWCLCDGKESGRLHHRFACEYHFKKPGKWPAVGQTSKTGGCTKQEIAQFKTYLCVSGGNCTYEYVRSSPSKVPLSAD
jgi:hypothetical protein